MEQRKIRLDKEKKKMMEKDLAIKKEEEKLKIWQEKMKNSLASSCEHTSYFPLKSFQIFILRW